MKIIAYSLIIVSFALLISTDILIENKVEDINIQQEMLESKKGKKLIISYLNSKNAALEFKLALNNAFYILFTIGIVLLLFNRLKTSENRLKKLDKSIKEK